MHDTHQILFGYANSFNSYYIHGQAIQTYRQADSFRVKK